MSKQYTTEAVHEFEGRVIEKITYVERPYWTGGRARIVTGYQVVGESCGVFDRLKDAKNYIGGKA